MRFHRILYVTPQREIFEQGVFRGYQISSVFVSLGPLAHWNWDLAHFTFPLAFCPTTNPKRSAWQVTMKFLHFIGFSNDSDVQWVSRFPVINVEFSRRFAKELKSWSAALIRLERVSGHFVNSQVLCKLIGICIECSYCSHNMQISLTSSVGLQLIYLIEALQCKLFYARLQPKSLWFT